MGIGDCNQLCVLDCPVGYLTDSDINSNQFCNILCPIGEVIEDNSCKSSCQNIINYNNNGTCQPCPNGTIAYNQLCVTSCPIGYLLVSDINNYQYCDTSCSLAEVIEDSICKSSCQSIINSNISGKCEPCPNGQLAYNQLCVSNCPVGYFLVSDINSNQYCDTSCPVSQVEENLICKSSCQNIINYNNNGTCEPCPNGRIAYNQVCVLDCPVSYLVVSDINSNQYCDTSCPLSEIIENSICKSSCQNIINFNNNGTCEPCALGTIAFNQLCVSNCPVGYVLVSDINNYQYFDTSCPLAEVIEDSICKSSCQNIINSNINGTCESCPNGQIAYNQLCVSNCPVGFVLVRDINNNQYCDTSCAFSEVIEDSICIASCQKRGNIENSQHVCDFCSNSQYLLNNICEMDCPLEYVPNTAFHDCELCPEPLFAFNGNCVQESECSLSSIIVYSSYRYCLYCSKQNKYKEENQCVTECSKAYYVANTNNVCDFCNNKIYFKN